MTGAHSADNPALLANTTAQAESPLYSLEEALVTIALYVSAGKTEFMSFKQEEAISTRSGKPLK